MPEAGERRAAPRLRLAEYPAARVRGLRGVRLHDISLTGAQIEHLDPIRPGAHCDLDLPPPIGAGTLPAQVVWCAVVGRTRKVGGESNLVARSGLRFTMLTEAQRAALTDGLQYLISTHQLIAPQSAAFDADAAQSGFM